jgi:raffinose/stachyose/melibiose transport system substrate-binding protein
MAKKMTVFVLLIALVSAGMLFAQGAQETQKVTVLKFPTFWVGSDTKAGEIAALVSEYNTMYEGKYKVEIEENPEPDGYRTKLNAQVSAGVVPDLMVFNPDPTGFSFYQGNLLMDFAKDLAGDWGKVFVDGSIQGATINGQTKSVPYEMAVTPIWVNMDLMKKAGVTEYPKNIDEFFVMCDKLKTAGVVPTSQMTGGTNAWTSMLWFSHLAASIGGPDVWSKPITDPVFEKAATYLLKMYSDGNTTKDAVGGDAGVSGGHYLAGRTAMFINGPWYIGRVRSEAPAVYAATEIMGIPAAGNYPGGQLAYPLSNLAAGATDDPVKRAATVAFMQHLTTPENVKRVSMAAGSLFAIKYQMAPGEQVDPLQKQFVEAVSNATFVTTHFAFNYTADVVAEFGQALGKMALGKATPAQFLQQINTLVK